MVNETFSLLASHFIKGMMVHDQLANYYDFLSLKGYKRCHEYHFRHESELYRKLNRFYVSHYGMLITSSRVEDPNLIPESWFRYTRNDVDIPTKKNAVKLGMSKWVGWERDTKAKLQTVYKDMIDQGEVETAMFIKELIHEVSDELKHAECKHLELMSVDYDMPYIYSEQEKLHNKYKTLLD